MMLRCFVAALALFTGCSKKADSPPPGPSGSAPKPKEGSDKVAPGPGTGSAPQAGPGSQLIAPHGIPLGGEALAKHHAECIASINANNAAELKEHCLHEKVVIHEVDYEDFSGADVALGYFTEMRGAMPDWKLSPQLVMIAGRNIMAVNLATGTQSGTLKLHDGTERKGTGKKVGVLAFEHLQVDDQNKTTEQWQYMDHHTLLDQLGITDEKGPSRAVVDKPWPGAPIILVTKDDANEQANLAVVAKMNEAFNARKAAGVVELMADDVVESDQAGHEDHRGKAAIEKGFQELFAAFPDAKLSIAGSFAAGDYVIVEGKLFGTHKGPLGPMKPTNKAIESSFAEVLKLKGGKITEVWRFRDGMALTSQLMAKDPPKDAPKDAPKDPPKK